MIRLVARKSFSFNGRDYRLGQRFEATAIVAAALTGQRLADFASAATPPASEPPSERPKRSRTYRRRDLEAEA